MQGRERQRALTRSVWGGQRRDTVTGIHNQIRNNTHEITRSENQSGQTWPDTAWPRINVPVSRNVWCPRAGVTVHCVYVNICYHRSHSRHEVMAMSHVLPRVTDTCPVIRIIPGISIAISCSPCQWAMSLLH